MTDVTRMHALCSLARATGAAALGLGRAELCLSTAQQLSTGHVHVGDDATLGAYRLVQRADLMLNALTAIKANQPINQGKNFWL